MTPQHALLVFVTAIGSLFCAAPQLHASPTLSDPPAVVTRGVGPTVVLLSGLLGGTARLKPLADQLIANGFRVIAIDPYRLSSDAADVSFAGLARNVSRAMQRQGVRSAIVVAHAHAAGVALRLAANSAELVTGVVLLDAGVMASTRSEGITRAMRVASIVSRLPGGNSIIRSRLVSGIRANSGNAGWLSEAVGRAYADPLIEDLPAVTRLAARLADAKEPESVDQLLARVRMDIIALIGAAPHSFAVSDIELALLNRIPGARVRRIEGVGHFVHEEAAQTVVAEVLASQDRRAVAAR